MAPDLDVRVSSTSCAGLPFSLVLGLPLSLSISRVDAHSSLSLRNSLEWSRSRSRGCRRERRGVSRRVLERKLRLEKESPLAGSPTRPRSRVRVDATIDAGRSSETAGEEEKMRVLRVPTFEPQAASL